MSTLLARLKANLDSVQQRMEAARGRSSLAADAVQLLAVTKYVPLEVVEALAELGITHVGESRPQQLLERAAWRPDLHWHLIGHLQRNKVRAVLPQIELIHSVDSVRLLKRIDEIATELALRPRVLLEVNVSGETVKDGFEPGSLREAWPEILQCQHLQLAGCMTMAPHHASAENLRAVFRNLRALRDELQSHPASPPLPELSMGMSDDFEVAIEEGATIVRLGSVLFENCDL